MAAKKTARAKSRKITRAKAAKKSTSMSGRKAPRGGGQTGTPIPKIWE